MLVPFLLWIRSRGAPPGRIAVLFVIFYALFRIPIDLLREYPISMWGLPTGQTLNIIMVITGLILLAINVYRARLGRSGVETELLNNNKKESSVLSWRPFALFVCCVIPLIIPSDATRDIPATYGDRHPGLKYSKMYPKIAGELENSESK